MMMNPVLASEGKERLDDWRLGQYGKWCIIDGCDS